MEEIKKEESKFIKEMQDRFLNFPKEVLEREIPKYPNTNEWQNPNNEGEQK